MRFTRMKRYLCFIGGFYLLLSLTYPLQLLFSKASDNVLIAILYYLMQLLELLPLFTFFGEWFRTAKEGGHILPYALILLFGKIGYRLIYGSLSVFLGEYEINLVLLWFLADIAEWLLLNGLIFVALLLLSKYLPKRFVSLIPLFPAFVYAIIATVKQIADTVSFISEDCYGIFSMASPGEIAWIVFDFVFIPLSLAAMFLWQKHLSESK